MTLLSAIILDAYRESNTVAAGATLSTAQSDEGLSRLSSLIAGVFGFDAGERLIDWPVGQENIQNPDQSWQEQEWIYPVDNSRLILDHTSAQTIYFPPNPRNGARIGLIDPYAKLATLNITLDGNGRLIEDAPSLTLLNNSLNATWMYRSDLANWQRINTLTTASEMPFPEEFDDYFIIKLAARLNPRYGRNLNELSMMRLADIKEQLEATYRQTRPMGARTAVQNLRGPRQYFRERASGPPNWMT